MIEGICVHEHLFFRAALNSVSEGLCFADKKGLIIYWNKSAERLSGYVAQEIQGKHCTHEILLHLDENGIVFQPSSLIAATLADGKMHTGEVFLHHKYGHRVSVTARCSPVLNDTGDLIGAVEVFTSNMKSITLLKQLEGLRKEVLTDELTGIGNRRCAEVLMNDLAVSLAEYDVPFGILFVDLDHFKAVNDTWGHHVGDKVLLMVAQTLVNGLRGLDVACRWGGEEFLILIPNIQKESLLGLGNRLRVLIENSWLNHEGQRIWVTASFGGAVSQKGETGAAVVNRADKQAYRSKQEGRNCVRVDDSNID